MARTLVSWLAYKNDFQQLESGGLTVNPEGPTATFHRLFWRYDRHVILSQHRPAREDPRLMALVRYLNQTHRGRTIEPYHVGVEDVINVREIKEKVERLLLERREDEVEAFISPGTPAMQTAWYLLGISHRLHLLQLRPADKSTSGHPELVEVTLERTPETGALALREETAGRPTPDGPFVPPSLEPVYARAGRIAQTDRVTALLKGESGTGKERLARFIHARSVRAAKPFVAINCAAWVSEGLLESRLFGYTKGTFTGAQKDTPGLVEAAEGGTLFLDEIGDVSPAFQATLLRFLQERTFSRVGEAKTRRSDVRVIAATHRDLAAACEEGRFRWDLYYRLAVADLELPPLRSWQMEDLDALVARFVEEKARLFERAPLPFAPEVRALVQRYSWPGNVRELENFVERLYVFCEDTVEVTDLPGWLRTPGAGASLRLEDVTRAHVLRVYRRFGENKEQAARALGIAVNTLKAKLAAAPEE